ncbi:MAG: hypothetical protein DRH11_11115 [Deltaproteobacteria bacterium]|nr:MAG: hypothetical protein DRH11_11115 [Deltaproteobacteria bacterium]
MPSTIIEDVKGSELPRAWANKIGVAPEGTYRVIIQPQEEYQSLREIMTRISRNAKSRGMTPEMLIGPRQTGKSKDMVFTSGRGFKSHHSPH